MDKNKIIPVELNCLTYGNGEVYLFSELYNQLYVMNITDRHMKSLGMIPWESIDTNRLFEKIIRVENILYLIPFRAQYLCIYNIDTGEFDRIDIRCGDMNIVFCDGFFSEGYLYLIGGVSSPIIRVDVKSRNIEKLKGWEVESESITFEGGKGYFRSQGILLNDCFITPFMNANAVLVFYYRCMEYKIIRLGKENYGYSGICKYKNGYVLAPRNGNIPAIICDNNFKVLEKISFEEDGVFTGVDINNDRPVFSYAFSNTRGDMKSNIKYDTTRISVDGDYRAYYHNVNHSLIIENHSETVFNGNVGIPNNTEEAVEWAYSFRNKIVTFENKGNNLEFFLKTI